MGDSPDWYRNVALSGKYNTILVPVSVDENGNLYTLMKGLYDTTPTVIAVDANGNIVSLMKGAYDSTLKTIAVDANGIMKANLTVQDLDFLTVRPAYGEGERYFGSISCDSGVETELVEVEGRGVVIGAYFRWSGASSLSSLQPIIRAEDTVIYQYAANVLDARHIYNPSQLPLYLIKYDETNFEYDVGVQKGITFETSFKMCVTHSYGVSISVYYDICFALTP